MNKDTAIYPGSFDPVTLGHLDIIKRAAKLFDKLIVVVMVNPNKKCAFSAEERVELLKQCTKDIENIEIEYSGGLLADFAKQKGAVAIIKGLRALSDFEYEFQMALTNSQLNPNVETLFLTTQAENMYLSSSMVKQIGSIGGDISGFVPDVIHKQIIKRLKG